MLPKKFRLTKEEEFQTVLRKGEVIQGSFLGLAFTRSGEDGPKIGIIVSRKISKKAVVRNRIKRAVREESRKYLEELTEDLLLVFLAKKRAAETDSQTIRQDVQNLFRKLLER